MFLGLNQYFVASDVGLGKMQWYAFHAEPPSSTDFPGGNFTHFVSNAGQFELLDTQKYLGGREIVPAPSKSTM